MIPVQRHLGGTSHHRRDTVRLFSLPDSGHCRCLSRSKRGVAAGSESTSRKPLHRSEARGKPSKSKTNNQRTGGVTNTEGVTNTGGVTNTEGVTNIGGQVSCSSQNAKVKK